MATYDRYNKHYFMVAESLTKSFQPDIAANWQQIMRNDFPMDRGLTTLSKTAGTSYLSYRGFGPALRREMLQMQDHDIWIDVGGGELFAQTDFLTRSFSQGHATIAGVVSVVDPDTDNFRQHHVMLSQEFPERFFYMSGRRIEDIPKEELPPARIVSDLFGALSFTEHVDITLQRELDALKVGGLLVARLQKAYIRDRSGKRFGIKRYAEAVQGAETLMYGWYTLVMRKTDEEIVVPPLELVNFISGHNVPNPKNLDPKYLFCQRHYVLE